jgi:hypothetical protein
MGREVHGVFNGEVVIGEKQFFFDVQGLAPGTYQLQILHDRGAQHKTLVVK